MLQSIALPFVIYALMLFVPGYLFTRCLRIPRVWALCFAPVISTSLVGLLGEAYAALGVLATPSSIYAPLVSLPLILLAVFRFSKHTDDTTNIILPSLDWRTFALYAVLGLYVCNTLFLSELPSPTAIIQNYDIQHHLNTIQALFDAQRISSVGISSYLAPNDAAIMPFGSASLYPSLWYGQCALLMQACNITTPVAINVSLAVSLGFAYPLCMCAFAASVFGKRYKTIAAGALTCISFAMFPWCLLIFGPLYPNLVGFLLMPASMALWMTVFRLEVIWKKRVPFLCLALLTLLGQALLQPNTLFSMFVILVPLVAQCVFSSARKHGLNLVKAVGVTAGFIVVCAGFWFACFKSPIFAVVIQELWPYYAYPWQEVINILTQTYTLFFYSEVTAQVLVGALVIIGFIRSFYDRSLRWLTVSYALVCCICIAAAIPIPDTLKRLLAGFWYTDAMRVSAMAIVVAALLAAHGFEWVYEEVCFVIESYNKRHERTTHPLIIAASISICFLVLNFMPGFNWPGAHAESTEHIDEYRFNEHEYDANSVRTTFGDFKQLLRNGYAFQLPIDANEAGFLNEVREIVGSDLVINNPYDGSAIAYGLCGIRTYYRRATGYNSANETEQSRIIRASLYGYETDSTVRQAVDDIGARYVLVLDQSNSDISFLHLRGDVENDVYAGISSITPDTPGFTELISSGRCHLYRIG